MSPITDSTTNMMCCRQAMPHMSRVQQLRLRLWPNVVDYACGSCTLHKPSILHMTQSFLVLRFEWFDLEPFPNIRWTVRITNTIKKIGKLTRIRNENQSQCGPSIRNYRKNLLVVSRSRCQCVLEGWDPSTFHEYHHFGTDGVQNYVFCTDFYWNITSLQAFGTP